MRADNSPIITGLDIGTTNTTVVISELADDQRIHILGYAQQPSEGIRRGGVINIDAVLRCVTTAIERAEQMAGQEVEGVALSIGGQHVEGRNSHGLIPVEQKNREGQSEISQDDVDRVMKAAGTVAIPLDREILHVMTQQYSVDDNHEIKNPLGMLGVRLEVDVHIITCFTSTVRNMIKAVNRAGFRVEQVLFSNVAAAETVLTKDEKELGVVLIDFGGGSTTLSIYKDDGPYFTTSVPVGGIEISTDLSIMLKAPLDATERLKCEYGSCQEFIGEYNEPVLIPGVGGRPPLAVERHKIVEIVKPRVYELLQILHDRVRHDGYDSFISGGAVLIGGGALLPGIAEATQEVLGVAARIGQPGNYSIERGYLPSDYSVAVGLVEAVARTTHVAAKKRQHLTEENKILFFVKKWLRNFFE